MEFRSIAPDPNVVLDMVTERLRGINSIHRDRTVARGLLVKVHDIQTARNILPVDIIDRDQIQTHLAQVLHDLCGRDLINNGEFQPLIQLIERTLLFKPPGRERENFPDLFHPKDLSALAMLCDL